MIGKTAAIALVMLIGLAAQEGKPKLEVVRQERCDGGNTGRIDLARVEKNYRNASAGIERALAGYESKAVGKLEDGYDAGLPDARVSKRTTWKPAKPLPEQLRGITIYVVTVNGTATSAACRARALANRMSP